MICLQKVTKSFGDFKALDQVSFTVESGEILGLLGPNGAGKTTTMRLITGFFHPDEGNIEVNGLDSRQDHLAISEQIGYLPEDNPLYPYLKVREYLSFIASVREVVWEEVEESLFVTCGIKHILQKNISQLSKGLRQRVGLAAAMIHDPQVLILDEPTAGLDPNQIAEIRELICRLGEKKTVIISTHILPEVEMSCQKVVIINAGKIVGSGSLADLTENKSKSLEQVFRERTLIEATL